MMLRRLTNKRAFLACAILAGIFVLWLCLPKPPLLDGISFSQCVRDRNGQLLDLTLTTDQKFRAWTPLSEISPHLAQATLRYEDKYYRQHPGINPVALARFDLPGRPSFPKPHGWLHHHHATCAPPLSPSDAHILGQSHANASGS